MNKSKCCNALIISVGEPARCYQCFNCGEPCEYVFDQEGKYKLDCKICGDACVSGSVNGDTYIRSNKPCQCSYDIRTGEWVSIKGNRIMPEQSQLSDRAHLFDEQKTEVEVLQEQVAELRRQEENDFLKVQRRIDSIDEHHLSMSKDHYANNEQLKKECQLIVNAQDDAAAHIEALEDRPILDSKTLVESVDIIMSILSVVRYPNGEYTYEIPESQTVADYKPAHLINYKSYLDLADRIEALEERNRMADFANSEPMNTLIKEAYCKDGPTVKWSDYKYLLKEIQILQKRGDELDDLPKRIEALECRDKTVYLKINVAEID